MKKLILMVIPALICGMLFTNCGSEDDTTSIKNGKYTGIFTVKYSEGDLFGETTLTGETTLKLNNGKYKCTGNPDRIPAGGSGKYSISDNKIIFEDENIWTTEFDGRLILDGEYDYTFDGKNLRLSKEIYEYDLLKK
ncbi:MAG: hypothetical protein FWF70_00195 [Bacteroidetes bacterium]|nr:hypothetical protein [Bacteroidota bacterium]MCL1969637.1 hypothetical protein [Bacteroidota bacterium]